MQWKKATEKARHERQQNFIATHNAASKVAHD